MKHNVYKKLTFIVKEGTGRVVRLLKGDLMLFDRTKDSEN
jgi:hypothetical protein